jgi:hypothetical protein
MFLTEHTARRVGDHRAFEDSVAFPSVYNPTAASVSYKLPSEIARKEGVALTTHPDYAECVHNGTLLRSTDLIDIDSQPTALPPIEHEVRELTARIF